MSNKRLSNTRLKGFIGFGGFYLANVILIENFAGDSIKGIREYGENVIRLGKGFQNLIRKGEVNDAIKYLLNHNEDIENLTNTLNQYAKENKNFSLKIQKTIEELQMLEHQGVRTSGKPLQKVTNTLKVSNKIEEIGVKALSVLFPSKSKGETLEEKVENAKKNQDIRKELGKIQTKTYQEINETQDLILSLKTYVENQPNPDIYEINKDILKLSSLEENLTSSMILATQNPNLQIKDLDLSKELLKNYQNKQNELTTEIRIETGHYNIKIPYEYIISSPSIAIVTTLLGIATYKIVTKPIKIIASPISKTYKFIKSRNNSNKND